MFQATDNDKLSAIMDESPENKEVISKLLEAHRLQISAISHEIRNPLSLVYSSIQLIEADHPEVRSYRHWAQMREDVEYMTRLLEELSSYNNGERLNLTATGMTSWLRTLALSFAASLIDTPIEFVSRIDPDLPVLPIDQVKFRQALFNLLGNARDALSDGANPAPVLTFSAKMQASGRQLVLTVSDNGCGIAPEDLDTLFEPFVTHKPGGTGLGLAIVRRVIRAHNGEIRVFSEPGKGSTFSVFLPVQQDPA